MSLESNVALIIQLAWQSLFISFEVPHCQIIKSLALLSALLGKSNRLIGLCIVQPKSNEQFLVCHKYDIGQAKRPVLHFLRK